MPTLSESRCVPSPPIFPNAVDVRRFGVRAAFVDSTNTGPDYSAELTDCFEVANGEGLCPYFPASNYGYFLGDGPGLLVNQPRVVVQGDGRGSTIVHEPAAEGQVTFDYDYGSITQLVEVGARGVRVMGFGADYTGPRFGKAAFRTKGVSEGRFENVATINWMSTSATPAVGFRSHGQEIIDLVKCRFAADRPVQLSVNPYIPIDVDGITFWDSYLGVYGVGESAVHLDANLDVRGLAFKGINNWVAAEHPLTGVIGGKYGLYWEDPTGTADATGISLEGVRIEQFSLGGTGAEDMVGASVYINRLAAYVHGLSLRTVSGNFKHRGFALNGTMNSALDLCNYRRYTSMGTSPLALDIGARTIDLSIRDFDLPVGTHDLTQFNGALTRKDRSQETRAQNRLYRFELWSAI